MAVSLNHTIVPATDRRASADFLSRILGLLEPTPWGPFLVVPIGNGVSLDFMDAHDFDEHHYAFLVDEAEFDPIFERIRASGATYYADPFVTGPTRSTTCTAAGASTSTIPTGTSWRSSPSRTARHPRADQGSGKSYGLIGSAAPRLHAFPMYLIIAKSAPNATTPPTANETTGASNAAITARPASAPASTAVITPIMPAMVRNCWKRPPISPWTRSRASGSTL